MDANDMPALRWDDIPDPSPADVDAADADLVERRLSRWADARTLFVEHPALVNVTWFDAPGAPNPRDGQLTALEYAALEGLMYIATPIWTRAEPNPAPVAVEEQPQHPVAVAAPMFAVLWGALIGGTAAWFIVKPLLGLA